MEAIRVLIVEDKMLIAEDIKLALRKCGVESAGICTTGEEAIEVARIEQPDLIIMDIHLAGALDGISTAHTIISERPVPIIYLTEHTNQPTLDRAKKTYPANFLTKPFLPDALTRAVEFAINNTNRTTTQSGKRILNNKLFLRTDSQTFVKVDLAHIVYLEAGRSYCKLVTDQKEYTLSNSMGHYHEQLSEDFVRVHRSFVVNINRITSLDGNVIHLDKWQVRTSKEYRDSLTRSLNILK